MATQKNNFNISHLYVPMCLCGVENRIRNGEPVKNLRAEQKRRSGETTDDR